MIPESTQALLEFKRTSPNNCGAFKLFAPMDKHAVVWVMDEAFIGGTSISISPNVKRVVCLCSDLESARIIKERISETEIENISIVIGRPDTPPFRKNSFNMICFHGMKNVNGQVMMIDQPILDTLQNMGILYFSFEYKKEEGIDNIFKRFRANDVERKLIDNGMKKIKVIQHYESFSNLHYVRAFATKKKKNIKEIYEYVKDRIKGDNRGYIYRKSDDHSKNVISLIQRIKSDIEGRIKIKLKSETFVWIGSTGSLVADFGKVIVRMPQCRDSENYCIRNFEMLQNLDRCNGDVLIPKPIYVGCIDGQVYYAESKISGISMDINQVHQNLIPHVLRQASSFLKTTCFLSGYLDEQSSKHLIEKPFNQISNILTDPHNKILNAVYTNIIDLLAHITLPNVICHGDYKFSNFICSQKKELNLSGVIDWEFSSNPGLPLYDLITLIVWNEERDDVDEYRIAQRIWNLASSDAINPLVVDYLNALNIDIKYLQPLLILSMITYLNHSFDIKVKQKDCWYREMIIGCLIPACESIYKNYFNN